MRATERGGGPDFANTDSRFVPRLNLSNFGGTINDDNDDNDVHVHVYAHESTCDRKRADMHDGEKKRLCCMPVLVLFRRTETMLTLPS